MGNVVTFPEARDAIRVREVMPPAAELGTIIILPVVRVDHYVAEEPDDGLRDGGSQSGHKGRRPTARR